MDSQLLFQELIMVEPLLPIDGSEKIKKDLK